MKHDFSGKTIVVIGAGSGIGQCVATRFSENGATTYFVSRSGAEEPVDQLKKRGMQAESVRLDVRDNEAMNEFINGVVKRNKKIDVLVNSQAVNQCIGIEKISISDWEDVIKINITSIFVACKTCIPYMKKRRYGKIINVSSVAARNRSPVSGVHYVASKAAILGFTRQLAYEVAPFGINVNAVCPGQTKTPMLMDSMTRKQRKMLAESIPLKRIAEPDDQANVIMFLATDEANYLSGAIVDVNGGQI